MQFQVPQYIDIEDKVIGPLTIKQFLYIAIAGAIIFILHSFLNLFVTIVLAIPIAIITFALAFIKVHNQPFINVIKNFLGFLKKPDFYVWKKPVGSIKEKTPEIIKKSLDRGSGQGKIKPVAKENLQEIGWKVEIEK